MGLHDPGPGRCRGRLDGVLILAFNVLTGAQTGNTVLLGVALVQGRLVTALGSTVSVVGYVIGAALGEFILVRHDDTWPWPSAVGTVLIAELIPLGCLFIFLRLVGPHPAQQTIYMLVIYAASAMGLQSAVMLHLDGGPTTTYITGTLTAFCYQIDPMAADGRDSVALFARPAAIYSDDRVFDRRQPLDVRLNLVCLPHRNSRRRAERLD